MQTHSSVEKKQLWKKAGNNSLSLHQVYIRVFLFTRFSSLNLNPVILQGFKKIRGWCSVKDAAGEFAGKAKLV